MKLAEGTYFQRFEGNDFGVSFNEMVPSSFENFVRKCSLYREIIVSRWGRGTGHSTDNGAPPGERMFVSYREGRFSFMTNWHPYAVCKHPKHHKDCKCREREPLLNAEFDAEFESTYSTGFMNSKLYCMLKRALGEW